MEMPKFTSWKDGFDFVSSKIFKKGDKRATIKAFILLSEFTPITFNEKTLSLLAISHAYSDSGDHCRAIEAAWQIPEQFPRDIMDNKTALRFIASEFDRLGDSKQASEIRAVMPCFTNQVESTRN